MGGARGAQGMDTYVDQEAAARAPPLEVGSPLLASAGRGVDAGQGSRLTSVQKMARMNRGMLQKMASYLIPE